MKNKFIGLGKGILLFFPILFAAGCHPNDGGSAVTGHVVDTVIIQQMKFTPEVLTVHEGDTIVWINKGLVDHNITEKNTKAYYSDTLHVGSSWKLAVTGSSSYLCSIHPSMVGNIIVK